MFGLYRNRTDPSPEPFPPGTRVHIKLNGTIARGTIRNMPMVLTPLVQTAAVPTHDTAPSQSDYTITLDDVKTRIVTFEDLTQETSPTNPASATIPEAFEGLPHFLQMGSKITMDHAEIFHKGFLGYIKERGYTFDIRRNSRSTKVDWSVPLPQFKQNWTNLVGEDIIIPGHSTVSSFLQSTTSNNAPSANFVSAKNLLGQCPPPFCKPSIPPTKIGRSGLTRITKRKGGYNK